MTNRARELRSRNLFRRQCKRANGCRVHCAGSRGASARIFDGVDSSLSLNTSTNLLKWSMHHSISFKLIQIKYGTDPLEVATIYFMKFFNCAGSWGASAQIFDGVDSRVAHWIDKFLIKLTWTRNAIGRRNRFVRSSHSIMHAFWIAQAAESRRREASMASTLESIKSELRAADRSRIAALEMVTIIYIIDRGRERGGKVDRLVGRQIDR